MCCLFVDVYLRASFFEYFLGGGFGSCLLTVRYFIQPFSIFNMSDVTSMALPMIKLSPLLLLSPMPVCFHQGTTALKLPNRRKVYKDHKKTSIKGL